MRCLLAGADHGPDGSFPEMGTWLGVNEAGMAVAVTNRHDGELAWADQIRFPRLARRSLARATIAPSDAADIAQSALARADMAAAIT